MADRSVVVRLVANVQGLVGGLNEGTRALESFGARGMDAIGRNEQSLRTLTNQAGVMGLAMVGAAGVAVKKFADFEQAMSAVEATGADAARSIEALEAAALEAGARTAYSATEAAGAIEELAKAGVTATDILNGGLDGALDLAAAGGIEVAEAAGIASIAMQQFGLRGEDMTHIADLLAAGAGKAMGGVDDLGMALKQSGLVAAQTGLTIEETTGALSAFAAAGLLGSDAGTSLKTMLQRLTPQSAEAAEQFAALGISAYDANGQFVGLEQFAGQLRNAMSDLTPEARNAALSVMFGSDAVRAASVLYEEGAQGISEWTDAVDDQGYAAETAATRLDNLSGDLEQFRGALDTALIQAGSGDFFLRDIVKSGTDVVNSFSAMPSAVQNAALAIVGGAGLVTLGVVGLGKLALAVNETRASFAAMSITARTAAIAIGAVGGVVAIGIAALSSWSSSQQETKAHVEALTESLDEQTGAWTNMTRKGIFDKISEDTPNWFERLALRQQSAADAADKLGLSMDTVIDAVEGAPAATAKLEELRAQLEGEFGEDGWMDRSKSLQRITQLIDEEQENLAAAKDGHDEYTSAVTNSGAAQANLAEDLDAVNAELEQQIPTLEELVGLQQEAAGVVLSERDAQRALQEAIDSATESLKDNGANLDINTEQGRANQSALDAIADSSWNVIESMRANGASQEQLQGQMTTSRQAFLDAAGAMGMGADEANRLADQMGLVPARVAVAVIVDTDEAERRLASFKKNLVMPDVVITPQMRAESPYYDGRASGGSVTGGRTYMVGENGPEILTMAGSGMITNHAASRAMGGGNPAPVSYGGWASAGATSSSGSGGRVVNNNIHGVTDPMAVAMTITRREQMLGRA